MRRVTLHEMGAGYVVVLVATVMPYDFKILLVPEPILPLGNSHLSLGCLWQITQDHLSARARELAEDGDAAVALALLP
jgi:hypothetical protein